MAKHAYLYNQKEIREVKEFADHLKDLESRLHGVDIRKMILTGVIK